MPFLGSSQRGAVKDESDGTNGDRYVTMLKTFEAVLVSLGKACCALC